MHEWQAGRDVDGVFARASALEHMEGKAPDQQLVACPAPLLRIFRQRRQPSVIDGHSIRCAEIGREFGPLMPARIGIPAH